MENIRKSRLYKVWIEMKNRCSNPNNYRYKRYGAKGITVCKDWKENYESFYNWAISNGYIENSEKKYTIDRIDNSKGYCPENCRFLSIQEQQSNKTNNHLITYKNETHTVSQWSRILNINVQTIFTRIEKGLSVEEILSCEKLNKKEVITTANVK